MDARQASQCLRSHGYTKPSAPLNHYIKLLIDCSTFTFPVRMSSVADRRHGHSPQPRPLNQTLAARSCLGRRVRKREQVIYSGNFATVHPNKLTINAANAAPSEAPQQIGPTSEFLDSPLAPSVHNKGSLYRIRVILLTVEARCRPCHSMGGCISHPLPLPWRTRGT